MLATHKLLFFFRSSCKSTEPRFVYFCIYLVTVNFHPFLSSVSLQLPLVTFPYYFATIYPSFSTSVSPHCLSFRRRLYTIHFMSPGDTGHARLLLTRPLVPRREIFNSRVERAD